MGTFFPTFSKFISLVFLLLRLDYFVAEWKKEFLYFLFNLRPSPVLSIGNKSFYERKVLAFVPIITLWNSSSPFAYYHIYFYNSTVVVVVMLSTRISNEWSREILWIYVCIWAKWQLKFKAATSSWYLLLCLFLTSYFLWLHNLCVYCRNIKCE
jgi:hypothetical protein